LSQGLVTNGSKTYIVSLPTDPLEQKVAELNTLGTDSGGSAEGSVIVTITNA
jgi:hypothetical protein